MRWHLGVLAGASLLSAMLTWPLLPRLFTHRAGHGDAEIFRWNLWWFDKAIRDPGLDVFYTRYLYHPIGVPLAMAPLSALNCVLALALIPVIGVLASFNALALLSWVLSAYFMFLLCRHVARDPVLALFPAFVFAFLPFHRAHLYQLDYLSIQWIPLGLLAWIRLGERPTALRGLLAGLAAAACFLACETYGAMLGVAALVLLAADLVNDRRKVLRRDWLAAAALAFATALAVSWPRLAPMVLGDVGFVDMPDASRWSADLLAYVTPALDHRLIGPYTMKVYQHFPGIYHNWTVFAGFTVLALAAAGWLSAGRRSPPAGWRAVVAVFFVLSLGPELTVGGRSRLPLLGHELSLPLPFHWLHQLPPFSTVRIPSLFSVFAACGLCVLSMSGILRLEAWIGRRFPRSPRHLRPLLVATLIALAYLEFMPADFPTHPIRLPAILAEIRAEAGDFAVLDAPASSNEAMYLQIAHQHPILCGTVARMPPATREYFASLPVLSAMLQWDGGAALWGSLDARVADEQLAAHRIRYVILHKEGLAAEAIREADRWLEQTSGLFRRVSDDQSYAVYRRIGRT